MSNTNSIYLDLTRSIYCPTCQGQVLEESNSQTAQQMKKEIIEMLSKGQSPKEIRLHYVAIYGENVLTQPSFEIHNLVLWLVPVIAFLAFLLIVIKRMRFAAHKK